MNIDRLRKTVHLVAGTAVLVSGFGLAALGAAGTAGADVCYDEYGDGSVYVYDC